MTLSKIRSCAVGVLYVLLASAGQVQADSTWVYAVRLSAVIQSSPPQIQLNWPTDPYPYAATGYQVYRKAKEATSWGNPVASLPGSAASYTDTSVQPGVFYEYQVVKSAVPMAYGYICSAIQGPLLDSRGTVVLVVESNATAPLSMELARLESDLVGDGWQVARCNVSSNDTPDAVRTLIANLYYADPVNVKAVFLFGHVPVLESGYMNYDTHAYRPMPADAFYGEMNPDWPTNPANSPSYLPSDVKLMVGRVDFFNMPGQGAPVPWPSETELLRNYLNKEHKWRHGLLPVPRRALMGDSRGQVDGDEAMAASGYRNFEPFVGPGNTVQANVAYNSPNDQRWISMLSAQSYLWAYGCGAGSPTSCGGIGTTVVAGNPGVLTSVEVVQKDPKVVFVMLFGSWFGQWVLTDDLMRAFLASPTLGLTCSLGGHPHWYVHHMAMGEPIGYGARLSMNNLTLYQNASNGAPRAVYVALMGDPTLRLEPVVPPSNLSGAVSGGSVMLHWNPSSDPVLGYHVYRATSPAGPFQRLTSALATNNEFTDPNPDIGLVFYLVRAVLLQQNPSGSYYNPSQGIVYAVDTSTNTVPRTPRVSAEQTTAGIRLTWDSQPGIVYHVQGTLDLRSPSWTDLSGPITATDASTSWSDADATELRRMYRVASP